MDISSRHSLICIRRLCISWSVLKTSPGNSALASSFKTSAKKQTCKKGKSQSHFWRYFFFQCSDMKKKAPLDISWLLTRTTVYRTPGRFLRIKASYLRRESSWFQQEMFQGAIMCLKAFSWVSLKFRTGRLFVPRMRVGSFKVVDLFWGPKDCGAKTWYSREGSGEYDNKTRTRTKREWCESTSSKGKPHAGPSSAQ